MAKVKYIIDGREKKGEWADVTMKVTINNRLKLQKKMAGIQVNRKYWQKDEYCHKFSSKFLTQEEIEKLKNIDKTLSDLKTEISARITSTPIEDINKEWFAAEVDNILHPEKNAPKVEKPKTLKQAIESFIEEAPNKVVKRKGHPNGVHIAPRTIYQYKQLQNQINAYLNGDDMEIIEVNEDFYNSFVLFLEKRGYKVNTIGYFIKSLKAVINSLPLSQRANCEFVSPKKCAKLVEDVENIYLKEDELKKIAELEIEQPYLDRVRDQFILLCWTGCRYSDLPKLSKDNITIIEGEEYYKIQQQKTGAKVTIPVLPETKKILDKYNYQLPKQIANQKFNEYVKEVAKKAEIKDWQRVTAHTARRSFATNMYLRDFPTLMIMRITGHKTEKAFLTYIKITEDENAVRMMRIFKEQEKRRKEKQRLVTGHIKSSDHDDQCDQP